MNGLNGVNMEYELIIFLFLVGIIAPLMLYINDLLFGNVYDGNFSKLFLEKMTVKSTSFLRKIMPFKELKGAVRPKFIYIRAIPLFIQSVFFIITVTLFLIDQLFIDFMIDEVFAYIGLISLSIYMLYELMLIILSKCFKM